MDSIEAKRAKEREKKKKQRAKLKQNEEKHAKSKKIDAERKKRERKTFKQEVASHPRRYKAVLDKMRDQNARRVRKCREKQSNHKQCLTEITPQKHRRNREKQQKTMSQIRTKEKEKKARNKQYVKSFRLRVKLQTNPARDPTTSTNTENPYRHRSRENRAYIRAKNSLPHTPAKKARIIEKLVEKSTPRTRRRVNQNLSVQPTSGSDQVKKNLSTLYRIIESIKTSISVNQKRRTGVVSVIATKLLKKSRNISSAARMLGLHPRALARSVELQDRKRKFRNDRVSTEHVSRIQNFYLEDASRQMPNKRDVLLLKDQEGNKVPVQKHIMEMIQHEAYVKFKDQNPSVKIGQRKFDSIKPEQVRRINMSNRIVCCCTYCENIRLKAQTLNQFVLKHTADKTFRSSFTLTNSTLCEKTSDHYSDDCIKRQCSQCGTKKLREQYRVLLSEKPKYLVMWKEWRLQSVPLNEDKQVTRVILTTCRDSFEKFFDSLSTSLEPHASHQFRASWQYEQFRENVNNLKDGQLVIAMDFSENYTCRHSREIQSYHWNQKQITLHPMMLYYIDNGKLQKDGYVIISDDLKHDSYAVAEFEKSAVQHAKDKGIKLSEIHEWTDGCSSQYKCKHSFLAISQAEAKFGVPVTRNYFETSHGKGPCDGLGGIVKRKVSNAVVQNSDINIANAADLHAYCDKQLSSVGVSSFRSRMNQYSESSRTFVLIQDIDRSNVITVKTLSGSRKLHSVSSTGRTNEVKVRELSCYCRGCRDNGECFNHNYVVKWNTRRLKVTDENLEPNDDEPLEAIQDMDSELAQNDFVAIKFETKKSCVCFFAKVTAIDKDDICVEYLEKRGQSYQYPTLTEESWQKRSDIISILQSPTIVVNGTRIKCVFEITDGQKDLLSGFKLQ